MICFVKCFLYSYQFFGELESILRGLLLWLLGKGGQSKWTTACLTQWNYEPCCVGPPKMDRSWWRVLMKCGPLEKGMANHFSILALRTPWTIWKGKKIGQGGLVCCSPWGHRVGHDWATELNWTCQSKTVRPFRKYFSNNPYNRLWWFDCGGNSAGGWEVHGFSVNLKYGANEIC